LYCVATQRTAAPGVAGAPQLRPVATRCPVLQRSARRCRRSSTETGCNPLYCVATQRTAAPGVAGAPQLRPVATRCTVLQSSARQHPALQAFLNWDRPDDALADAEAALQVRGLCACACVRRAAPRRVQRGRRDAGRSAGQRELCEGVHQEGWLPWSKNIACALARALTHTHTHTNTCGHRHTHTHARARYFAVARAVGAEARGGVGAGCGGRRCSGRTSSPGPTPPITLKPDASHHPKARPIPSPYSATHPITLKPVRLFSRSPP
jgi:hypothetical protein